MNLKDTRWLVTGDTGFIGRRAIAMLLANGATVLGLSRGSGFDLSKIESARMRIIDFAPQYVLHLASAGVTGHSEADELWRVNVEGTHSLMRILSRSVQPSRIIISGTGAEYAPQQRFLTEHDPIAPISSYGKSKVEAARIAKGFKDRLSLVWLRLFNVYGPGESPKRLVPYLVKSALAGTPAELSSSKDIRDFSFVDDVVNILFRFALVTPTAPTWEVYNIGSGLALPIEAFVEKVAASLKKRGLKLQTNYDSRTSNLPKNPFYAPSVVKMSQKIGHDFIPTLLDVGIEMTVEAVLQSSRPEGHSK